MPTALEQCMQSAGMDELVISELIMSMMGVDQLAYIKPCPKQGFVVFAADGTELASFDSKDEAFYSIRRHNLTPVNVH